MIAEVHVDKKTGIVTPIKVVCSQDMGQVVNPNGAAVQTEGGITMGLGYALYEEVMFNGGSVKSRNFSNYTITKFSNTPEIECVFIDKMDSKPQGGGEPAIICVDGAIGNAWIATLRSATQRTSPTTHTHVPVSRGRQTNSSTKQAEGSHSTCGSSSRSRTSTKNTSPTRPRSSASPSRLPLI